LHFNGNLQLGSFFLQNISGLSVFTSEINPTELILWRESGETEGVVLWWS
jgi:hypothetical protein